MLINIRSLHSALLVINLLCSLISVVLFLSVAKVNILRGSHFKLVKTFKNQDTIRVNPSV